MWSVELSVRPVDDHLRLRLNDFRRYRVRRMNDWLWVRLVDISAALSARSYTTEDTVTIEVDDGFRPANSGVYRIESGPDGAVCERVDVSEKPTCTCRSTYSARPISAAPR